jgi:hypothetical protein
MVSQETSILTGVLQTQCSHERVASAACIGFESSIWPFRDCMPGLWQPRSATAAAAWFHTEKDLCIFWILSVGMPDLQADKVPSQTWQAHDQESIPGIIRRSL